MESKEAVPNWTQVLADVLNREDHQFTTEEKEAASSWDRCALGECAQMYPEVTVHPVMIREDLAPDDLVDLGVQFARAVTANDVYGAKAIHTVIRRRVAEILSQPCG